MNNDRRFSNTIYMLFVLTMGALFTACGGGGGGGDGSVGNGGGNGGGGSTSGYTIGGTVVGLASGATVTLQNNGGDTLVVSNGAFTFATRISSWTTYNVTVSAQPANGQTCALTERADFSSPISTGTGTAYGPIDTVRVSCASVFTFAGSGVSGHGDATGEEAVFYGPSGIAMDTAGNIYVSDYYNNVLRKITPAGVVTTLAGAGVAGYNDATGTAARFRFVATGASRAGVTVDAAGNVYVADTGNHAIRKITPAGVVTTLAGSGTSGYADATGSAAQFNAPRGVSVDSAGDVYVADTGNNRIRKITAAGAVTTLAGSGVSGSSNGTGTSATFSVPQDVAVDRAGNVYVADSNFALIRKITSAGVVTTLAGSADLGWGYVDATGANAEFRDPVAIAVDASGNVYVADNGNGVIRFITPAGVVSTLAGTEASLAFADGPATTAKFYSPDGVAVDAAGNVYVADWGNRRIRKISATPFTYTIGGHAVGLASGASLVLQNNGNDNLTVTANGVFAFTTPLSITSSYSVTVSAQPAGQTCTVTNPTGSFTTGNVHTIKINCAAVSTLAGSGTAGFADATGTAAQFRLASVLNDDNNGVAVDTAGNVYVADTFNHRIRKITPAGVVTTLAGSGTAGYADATGTAAQFNRPRGIGVDGAGNVYVADTQNNRIRKLTSAGVVTTFAGSGVAGSMDGTGSGATFYLPMGLAVDAFGNVYVAESTDRIRKITSTGVVTTVVGGSYGAYINGPVATAAIRDPSGVAIDTAGNIYVADTGNYAVRKITPAGMVTTLAGSEEGYQNAGYVDSTGTGARFRALGGIAVDGAGNVYVADHLNHVVRRITPAGTVSTLAGSTTGSTGYVDGNGAIARFNKPSGVAVDAFGNVYVTDSQNNVIRKIWQ